MVANPSLYPIKTPLESNQGLYVDVAQIMSVENYPDGQLDFVLIEKRNGTFGFENEGLLYSVRVRHLGWRTIPGLVVSASSVAKIPERGILRDVCLLLDFVLSFLHRIAILSPP